MAETLDFFLNESVVPRAFAAFVMMSATETCLGILRIFVLANYVSKPTLEKLGIASAMTSVLAISYSTIDWIHPVTRLDLAKIGVLWYGSMIGFDVLIGRLAGSSWDEIKAALNPVKGGYLGLYMSVLFVAPFVAYGSKHSRYED